MTFMFKTSRYMWEPMGNRAICFSSLLKKSRRERASHQKGLWNLFLQERMIKFGWKKYRSCHLLITIKKIFLSKVQSKDEHVKRFLLVCSVFILQQVFYIMTWQNYCVIKIIYLLNHMEALVVSFSAKLIRLLHLWR